MSEPCPSCGYIHASTDARAIGRFGTAPTRYVAATAGTPPRETRAEAEADECASRIRPKPQTSGADAGVAAGDDRGAVRGPARPDVPTAPEHLPFPAVEFETAARAKAWHDFLAQLRLSLMVWDIDSDVRSGCEPVLAWLARCRDDLNGLGATP
jgi:hypothetical protein